MMNMYVRILSMAAIGSVSAATLFTGPASGASVDVVSPHNSCWYSSSQWWCNNVSGAPVYGFAGDDLYPVPSDIVGYMYSNPSWFDERRDDGPYVGGPHPHRWVFTEADNGKYGWMKDTDIYSETDPLPVHGS